MVVDAAVIGFARERGVGHDDAGHRRSGQPRLLRIGGQQHRPQRRLAEQPAPLVEAQQHLRSAVDAGHRVGVGEVRRHRRSRRGRVHPVDLHRRVARSQAAVGDEAAQRAGADRVAELRDLRQPRRTVDGAVHQHGSRRARRLGIQVVAHHDIRDALPGKGISQPRRRPAGGEQPLHGVQCADGFRRGQRNRVPHTPRAVAEHLQRLVVAGAPHLGGERRAGGHQHPAPESLCSSSQSAVSCQYCGIASNAPGGVSRPVQASEVAAASATSTTRPTAIRLSRSGWANASRHTATRRAARQRDPAQQMRQTQARAAAVTAARVCGCCAAVCRPRRGTLEQQGPQAIPDHRSIPAPARRHRRAGW